MFNFCIFIFLFLGSLLSVTHNIPNFFNFSKKSFYFFTDFFNLFNYIIFIFLFTTLNRIFFFNLFKKYFGDTVAIDELQKIIWARIPHFYNSPFYVYQYATSFASSAKLYEDLKANPENREKYLTLLKSGGNNHPMEQLKLAGVDLTKKESFDAVAKEFDRLLDILEDELKKINLV